MTERITGQTDRGQTDRQTDLVFLINKDFAPTGLNLKMLRDGKETLFFSKVLLPTGILG